MKIKLLFLSVVCCMAIQLHAQPNTIPAKPNLVPQKATTVRLPAVNSIVLVKDSVTASQRPDGTPTNIYHFKATISSYGLATINYRWAFSNLTVANSPITNKTGSITTNGTGTDIVYIDAPNNGLYHFKIALVVDAPTTIASNPINY